MTSRESNPSESAAAVPAEPVPAALAASSDYEVVREINRGGMGVVYLVRNRRMDRLEALKVVRPALLERDGALERFEREMRSAARLNHTNIVAAYSAPPLEGLVAFAMEYVEGTDLQQLVKTRGPLSVAKACFYIYQAALGLQHAADRQMVHRDIKPANLMLARDGKRPVVKILDFGLAKATLENPIDGGLTGEGQVLGTPQFMAPEQIRNAATADIRADVYSLGCTLYYLLSGAPPFHDKRSVYDIFQAHQKELPRPLNESRSDVPAELAAIVDRMTAKDPRERYQQPSEVAQALGPFFRQGSKTVRDERAAGPAHETESSKGTHTLGERAPRTSSDTQRSGAFILLFGNRRVLTAAGICLLFLGGLGLWAGGFFGGRSTDDVPLEPDDVRQAGAAVALPPPAEFVPLFNGRDLAGWKVTRDDYAAWRVEEGQVAVSCAHWKSASVLYTEKRYANYRLRLEYKVDPGARCRFVPRFLDGETHVDGDPAQAGIGIQDDEYVQSHPEVRGPRHTGNFLVSRDFKNHVPVDEPAELHPSGTWNLLEVEVRAQALTCAVNGKTILRTHLDDLAARENAFPGLRQTWAPIGLEGATGTVRFRNITIDELPPTVPERIPAADTKFSPLFNGQDLSGWRVVDLGKKDKRSHWRVSNGAIAGSAHEVEKRPPVFLASDREFGEYVVRFEFRKTREPTQCGFVYHAAGRGRDGVGLFFDTPSKGSSAGALRYASGKFVYPLDHAPLNGLDEWNEAEVDVRQGKVRVVINGVEVQKTASRAGEKSDGEAGNAPPPGRIGFSISQGEVEFRKIEVWER